jgi:predicted metal-dependent hydrolase
MHEQRTPCRLMPERPLPRYAFLPARHPHPIRDADGHSHDAADQGMHGLAPDESLRWGLDLFAHGYYWEAHEAWEAVWAASAHGSPLRALTKGLILLAASGVKLRTGKAVAAERHARRASALLRTVGGDIADTFKTLSGVAPNEIADIVDRIAFAADVRSAAKGAPPEIVPSFALLRFR